MLLAKAITREDNAGKLAGELRQARKVQNICHYVYVELLYMLQSEVSM